MARVTSELEGAPHHHQAHLAWLLVINIWVTHNYLFTAACFILESPDRPGSSQHYRESTFTIPDTPQNTVRALYGQKLRERENKSLEMKETSIALKSCMIVEIGRGFFSKASIQVNFDRAGQNK